MRDLLQDIRTRPESEVVEELTRYDLHKTDEGAQSALHECAARGKPAVARALLNAGVNPDQVDKLGMTALHYAAARRNVEVVRALLDGGASVNVADNHGNEALWAAVMNAKGEYAVVRALMESRADPRHLNRHGRSPLSFAVQIGDEVLVRLLRCETA